MIHRHIEEALNLRRVQVHRQNAVSSRLADQICHQFGTDGVTRLVLAVLTRIAVIGHHRGNPPRRGTAERVDHQKQLHQVPVDRAGSALDHKDVAAAHRLADRDADLTVREHADLRLAQRKAQALCDRGCQLLIRIACEDLDIFAVDIHIFSPVY